MPVIVVKWRFVWDLLLTTLKNPGGDYYWEGEQRTTQLMTPGTSRTGRISQIGWTIPIFQHFPSSAKPRKKFQTPILLVWQGWFRYIHLAKHTGNHTTWKHTRHIMYSPKLSCCRWELPPPSPWPLTRSNPRGWAFIYLSKANEGEGWPAWMIIKSRWFEG